MKKLLIACASGLPNSGDEALLRAILLQIKGTGIHPVALSFDAEYTRRFHGIEAYSLGSGKDVQKAFQECDMVLLGGGGLIQDETTIYNPYRWLRFIKLATQYTKPCIVYGNSIGPLNYAINRFLAKKYLNKAAHITVRDDSSYSLMKKIGVTAPMQRAFDPVFSLEQPDKSQSDAVMHQHDIAPHFVFISLRHWFDTHPLIPVKFATRFNIKSKSQQADYDSFINNMQQCCNELIDRYGCQLIFHAFRPRKDARVAEHVAAGLRGDYRIIDDPDMKPETVISLMQQARLTVGMRLHSLIYSIIASTPFIALSYSQKVNGMLAVGGLETLSIPVDGITLSDFSNVLSHIESDPDGIRTTIDTYYKRAHAAERKTLSNILESIDTGSS